MKTKAKSTQKAKKVKEYTKEQFLADVSKEVKALKKYATKEELNKLNFYWFKPHRKDKCIYGQMTGSCLSNRASKLIFQCCKRFVKNNSSTCISKGGFGIIKEQINGTYVGANKSLEELKRDRNNIHHLSSLESYIFLPKAKNRNVISYLKGETQKLVL